jgi:hypothetical protein
MTLTLNDRLVKLERYSCLTSYSINFFRPAGGLPFQKVGKIGSIDYNRLLLKIKKFFQKVTSWPIILFLGHGTQNMKTSISFVRK